MKKDTEHLRLSANIKITEALFYINRRFEYIKWVLDSHKKVSDARWMYIEKRFDDMEKRIEKLEENK